MGEVHSSSSEWILRNEMKLCTFIVAYVCHTSYYRACPEQPDHLVGPAHILSTKNPRGRAERKDEMRYTLAADVVRVLTAARVLSLLLL